jgi:hypothetical protein
MSNGYGYYYDWLNMRWVEKTGAGMGISWPRYHRLPQRQISW